MALADNVLGVRRPRRFSRNVSRILYHIEPSQDGIASYAPDIATGAEIATQLISCATELETGWNALRLGNIPASQRQGRVASEFSAIATLLSIPREALAALPRSVPVSKALQDNPRISVANLYEPRRSSSILPEEAEPILRATQFYASFLYVAEHLLGLPNENIEWMRGYRRYVQHPASHSSAEVVQHHFEAFNARTKRAGAYITRRKYRSLRFQAEELIGLSHLIAELLDWTALTYLSRKPEDA
jgi:hypothetical protein